VKRLTVHVGQPKTGTKSIQSFLLDLNSRTDSFCYPLNRPKVFRHRVFETESEAEWQRFLLDVEVAFDSNHITDVVLSNEGCFAAIAEEYMRDRLAQLKCFEDRAELRVICYLRPQNEWLITKYKQSIRSGNIYDTHYANIETYLVAMQESGWLDYYGRMSDFASVVGLDAVVVRPYDCASWLNGNLVHDFVSSIGMSTELCDHTQWKHKSLSDAEAELYYHLLKRSSVKSVAEARGLSQLLSRTLNIGSDESNSFEYGIDSRYFEEWYDGNQRLQKLFSLPSEWSLFQPMSLRPVAPSEATFSLEQLAELLRPAMRADQLRKRTREWRECLL
jgi:hypothetical protein